MRQPFFRDECSSDAPTRTRVLSSPAPTRTDAKASTIHSYHTFLSSVCRQMLTCSSEASGK